LFSPYSGGDDFFSVNAPLPFLLHGPLLLLPCHLLLLPLPPLLLSPQPLLFLLGLFFLVNSSLLLFAQKLCFFLATLFET
jgi:hypothetical protein